MGVGRALPVDQLICILGNVVKFSNSGLAVSLKYMTCVHIYCCDSWNGCHQGCHGEHENRMHMQGVPNFCNTIKLI
uniref:Secreted protein n=1 Tax=Steinernema glaseri TaxID=37863 RepID=A0A1I7ZH93_9BILA